ncbi:metal tolerance protein C4 [Magnolia sinica]|uniref:metal tolerance protein C4 n=1 Tax=Magnolia sinica TaxID=86752 RepID=UPI00265A8CCC|nr:metal tolerance protein C4 [Magnolia sinica]
MQKRNPSSHLMRAVRLVRRLTEPVTRPHPTALVSSSCHGATDTSKEEPLKVTDQREILELSRHIRFRLAPVICIHSVIIAPELHKLKRKKSTIPGQVWKKVRLLVNQSQRAVTTALWCNFLVFSLKFGVWRVTSSHVMFAEVVHSVADFANQALLAYGLSSSRRAPDALHPYGYSKERFVWSLISAVGIFCLGSGATIVHGFQNLWNSQPPPNIHYAALVIGGSFIMEGVSLIVAINAVKRGAAAEGMTVRDYVWRGHDPTSVAVMTEDGAAVTGLAIAAASLVAVNKTGNPIYDPIGSIIVGNLLGMVAIFLIQRNRHALIGRAIDDHDMERVLRFLKSDPVVDALYDCKSEVIGPGFFRFKAEIDFNGVVVVQNYLERTGREEWARQFREAAKGKDDAALLKSMSCYGEEVVTALGSEVDRLEKEIQRIVPGIRHVDIEAHNPKGPSP